MIGVDEMTIVNWEKGKVRPTKRDLGRIKGVFRFRPSKCITE